MNNDHREQETIFDEIIAKIDSIQKDHLVKETQKLMDEKEQPSIVDEAIFDEIKNAQPEVKPQRPKSPIQRMLEEEEEENTAEEEHIFSEEQINAEDLEDIEDYESEDEKEEIYRDLKNTVGKMAVKSIAVFILTLVSLYLFIAAINPQLFINRVDGVGFQVIHLIMDVFCVVLFHSIFSQGLMLLLRAKADTDTFLALLNISLIAIRVANIINPDLLPYQLNLEPMLLIGLLFNINAKKKIASNIKRNFKNIAASGDKFTISRPRSCEANNALILETEEGGDVVYAHRTGLVSGFIENSYSDYDWDHKLQRFLFVSLLFIVAGTIALVQLNGWGSGLLFPGAALATTLPFFARHFYASSIWRVGKRIRKRGGMLTSAASAKDLEDCNLMVLSDKELLGEDAVLLQGVKAIGDMNIDTLITYIAALFEGTNSPLKPLFMKMIDSKSVRLPKVNDLYYHFGTGYTCLIQSKMFLVGNAEFMKNFNIEFPEKMMNLNLAAGKFPIYVAYHKSPVGVFIASYESNKNTLDGLLYAEKMNLSLGVVSGDFNFNHQLLKVLYPMVETQHFVHILSKPTAEECEYYIQDQEKSPDVIASRNGFKGVVGALLGARALLSALKINRVIRVLYSLVALFMIFFIAISGYAANTDLQILAFQSMWLLPVCAICLFCK